MQYDELNQTRNKNIKKLKKLIRNGIDDTNIQLFYSQFPENPEIAKVYENYKKEKKEIEVNTFRNKDDKKLNPLKKSSTKDNEDKFSKTTYDFKNKTIKIPKLNLIEKSNVNSDNYNEDSKKYEKKENHKLINICSTNNDKSKNKKDDNNKNGEKANEIKNINDNINTSNTNEKENLNNNKNIKENDKEKDNIGDEKRVLFETEIRDKIKEYKKERYQPFIKMLEREKILEENRNKKLEGVENEEERKKLENQLGKERTLVSLRLKKENEKVLLDIEKFEKNLREENERNQKYNMDRINF